MKRIVLYDDEIETVKEGYYIDWEYFKKIMEEVLWEIIKPETQADQKKRPDLADFYLLYDDKTIPIEELCRIWKVKKQTIYQWSSYYNKKIKRGDKRLIS